MTRHQTTRQDLAGVRGDQGQRPTSNGEDYLTPAQFADAMSISTRTVRNWINSDYVQATRVGPRLIRIPASELTRIAVPLGDQGGARPSR